MSKNAKAPATNKLRMVRNLQFGHITTKIYYEQVCDLYKFVSNSKIKEALEESDESDTEEIDATESTTTIS